jgi:hypothetical protein
VTDDGSWIIVGVAGAVGKASRTGEARKEATSGFIHCRVTVAVTAEWHGSAGRRDSRQTFGGVDHSSGCGEDGPRDEQQRKVDAQGK